MLEVSILVNLGFHVSWKTQKNSACNSLILPREGLVELLNSSFLPDVPFQTSAAVYPSARLLGTCVRWCWKWSLHGWSSLLIWKQWSQILTFSGTGGLWSFCTVLGAAWPLNCFALLFLPEVSLSPPALSMSMEIIFK